MPAPSDDEVDHLLSRGGLGRRQKERMLAEVLAALPARAPAGRRRWWIWGATGAGSLAAGLAVLALWLHPTGGGNNPELRAKGGAAEAPLVDVSCLGGSVTACPRGSRVAFSLEGGPGEAAFVTAFAEPIGGGERIWYLTNQALAASPPDAGGAPRVVPKATLIGDDHPPGHYRLEVIVSRRAVSRTDLAHLAPADLVTRAQFQLGVSP